MKTIRFRLLIAAMAVLLVTGIGKSQTASDTQPTRWQGPEFGMGRMGFFARQLNLTDEQKTQMKAIVQKEHLAMKPLLEQQRQIDLQLRQNVEGTYDAAKVQALAAQKAQIQAQLTVAETRMHSELYQLLTPDQQSQLKEMEANREARMQQHMQDAPPTPPEE
jgi:Spy/CpxP family protein refolding chaperone